MKKYLPLIIVVIVVIVGAGIAIANKDNSSNNKNTSNTDSSNSTSHENMSSNSSSDTNNSQTATNEVEIEDFNFTPKNITVKKGTTVKWTNKDSAAHTVTSDSGNKLDSENLEKGESYEVTFDEVGSFAYHCALHASMTGKVTVTE